MSGLREEREFGETLVQGIRVLWRAEVCVEAFGQPSRVNPLPQGEVHAVPVGAGSPAIRLESQAGTVAFIDSR